MWAYVFECFGFTLRSRLTLVQRNRPEGSKALTLSYGFVLGSGPGVGTIRRRVTGTCIADALACNMQLVTCHQSPVPEYLST